MADLRAIAVRRQVVFVPIALEAAEYLREPREFTGTIQFIDSTKTGEGELVFTRRG